MSETLSHVLAAAAVTLWLMAVIGSQANAATPREHRGAGSAPQPTFDYTCKSLRRCA